MAIITALGRSNKIAEDWTPRVLAATLYGLWSSGIDPWQVFQGEVNPEEYGPKATWYGEGVMQKTWLVTIRVESVGTVVWLCGPDFMNRI